MGWRAEGSTDHGYREDLFINVITLIELFLSPRIVRIMRGKFCLICLILLINIYCDTRGNSRGGFMVNVITLIILFFLHGSRVSRGKFCLICLILLINIRGYMRGVIHAEVLWST